MKLLGEFTFLKLEKGQTRATQGKDSKDYLIINLLDNSLNSCKFFVFDKDLIVKLLNLHLDLYKKVHVALELSYYKDVWNVALVDLDVKVDGK